MNNIALIAVSMFAGFSISQAYLLYDDETSYLAGVDNGVMTERALNEYCMPLSKAMDDETIKCVERLYGTEKAYAIISAYKVKRGIE